METRKKAQCYAKWEFSYTTSWFKHILLVNTKGLGVAKLRRKPSPKYPKLICLRLFLMIQDKFLQLR